MKIVCRDSREEGDRSMHGSLSIADGFCSFAGLESRLESSLYSVAFFNLRVTAIMVKFRYVAKQVECQQPRFD